MKCQPVSEAFHLTRSVSPRAVRYVWQQALPCSKREMLEWRLRV